MNGERRSSLITHHSSFVRRSAINFKFVCFVRTNHSMCRRKKSGSAMKPSGACPSSRSRISVPSFATLNSCTWRSHVTPFHHLVGEEMRRAHLGCARRTSVAFEVTALEADEIAELEETFHRPAGRAALRRMPRSAMHSTSRAKVEAALDRRAITVRDDDLPTTPSARRAGDLAGGTPAARRRVRERRGPGGPATDRCAGASRFRRRFDPRIFSVAVRLKHRPSAVESGSTQK